jgi:hypothetical protein
MHGTRLALILTLVQFNRVISHNADCNMSLTYLWLEKLHICSMLFWSAVESQGWNTSLVYYVPSVQELLITRKPPTICYIDTTS